MWCTDEQGSLLAPESLDLSFLAGLNPDLYQSISQSLGVINNGGNVSTSSRSLFYYNIDEYEWSDFLPLSTSISNKLKTYFYRQLT